MAIINSIEKTRLSADSFSYSGSGVAWKARVVLFLGFASLAGGMAGGVTVLVLKYIVPQTVWPTLYMGVANVLANALIMLRYGISVCRGRKYEANIRTARSCFGSRRIWRMNTPITCPYKWLSAENWSCGMVMRFSRPRVMRFVRERSLHNVDFLVKASLASL